MRWPRDVRSHRGWSTSKHTPREVVLWHYSPKMTLPDKKSSLVWPDLSFQGSQETGPDQPVLVVDVGTGLSCLNTGSILEKMSTLLWF